MIPDWIEKSATNPAFIAEVIRHMKVKHNGRDRADKLPGLLAEMLGSISGSKSYSNDNRTLRRAFEIVNQDHCGMIVSDTEVGYWWAANLAEGMEAVEKNKARAKTILSNAHTVESNITAAYGGQIGMTL